MGVEIFLAKQFFNVSDFLLLVEGPDEEFRIQEFLSEIGFMINVGEHPNVLNIYGCCTTEKPVYLVTEFLKYGDLLHFLWDAREVRFFLSAVNFI